MPHENVCVRLALQSSENVEIQPTFTARATTLWRENEASVVRQIDLTHYTGVYGAGVRPGRRKLALKFWWPENASPAAGDGTTPARAVSFLIAMCGADVNPA